MTRLRFLADVNPATPDFDAIDETAPVAFVPLEDVWPPPRWAPSQQRPRGEVSSGYTRFRTGDILIPKITPTFEAGRSVIAEGLLTPVAAGTTELHVVRTERANPRYLNYCFQTKLFLDGGEAAMVGVAGQKRVPETWLLNYDIPVDDQSLQRKIADFLDAETRRIDALINKKQFMARLVSERLAGQIEADLRALASNHGEIALRHLADVTVGIVVTPAAYYADEGVPALRGLNVLPGHLKLDDLVYLSQDGNALHPKSQLRAGDVVTVRTGQAGATAVVPSELDGANCVDLLITRPHNNVSPHFLELVINSDWCIKHIEKHAVGAIQGHFNVEALKNLPIPRVESPLQAELVDRVRAARVRAERLAHVLGAQARLLREHRRALITAAVTGDLEVAKAAA